ncbi:hypothetical protein DIE15_04835 [Burkholderia sp. Bp9031]|nr:hypothetical protein DIE15_04835 [Burkholderia sp. Bp9031]
MAAARHDGRHAVCRRIAWRARTADCVARCAGFLQRTHGRDAKFPAQQYAGVVRPRTMHRAIP